MKNLKLILLLIAGLFGSQLFGMQAVRNHWKKGAVAATAALTYGVRIKQENDLKQAVKNLPNLNWLAAADLWKSLISSVPTEVDQDKLGKIKFKKIDKLPFISALDVDGSWTIVSGPSIISTEERWSDFAYLHQVARLNNKDDVSKALRCAIGWSCLNAGMVHCFLKNPSFKRGLVVVPLYCLAALGFELINNLAGYRAERRADEFAIQALKAQKNLKMLENGALEFAIISSPRYESEEKLFELEKKYPFLLAAIMGKQSSLTRCNRLMIEAEVLRGIYETERISKTSDRGTMV